MPEQEVKKEILVIQETLTELEAMYRSEKNLIKKISIGMDLISNYFSFFEEETREFEKDWENINIKYRKLDGTTRDLRISRTVHSLQNFLLTRLRFIAIREGFAIEEKVEERIRVVGSKGELGFRPPKEAAKEYFAEEKEVEEENAEN